MKQLAIQKITNFKNWDEIETLNDFSSPWVNGIPPETLFKAYYDDSYLYFQFMGAGTKPLVYVTDNSKMEVNNSERVEIFFRINEKMQPYYCLEMDAHGRVMDFRAKFYKDFEFDWNWPEPLFIQSNITDEAYTVQGKFSLTALKQLGLLTDSQIQIGLFRGHCIALEGDNATFEWISWADPKTPEPDFHVPSAFGILIMK